MVSSIGGLVIPEMRVGEVAISRVWLLEVGIEGVPLLVPVLDSEVLTFVRDDKRPSPGKQIREMSQGCRSRRFGLTLQSGVCTRRLQEDTTHVCIYCCVLSSFIQIKKTDQSRKGQTGVLQKAG